MNRTRYSILLLITTGIFSCNTNTDLRMHPEKSPSAKKKYDLTMERRHRGGELEAQESKRLKTDKSENRGKKLASDKAVKYYNQDSKEENTLDGEKRASAMYKPIDMYL